MEKQTIIRLSRHLYPAEAIKKAAYKYIDRYYVYLDLNSDYYLVNLKSKGEQKCVEGEFINEVLAQTIRYEVYKKTHIIRELLMARAMASTIIGKIPEIDEAMDTDGDNLEEILTDWFDKYESNEENI